MMTRTNDPNRLTLAHYQAAYDGVQQRMSTHVAWKTEAPLGVEEGVLQLNPTAGELALWRDSMHYLVAGLASGDISGRRVGLAAAIGHSFGGLVGTEGRLMRSGPNTAFAHRLGNAVWDAARAVGYAEHALPEELDFSANDTDRVHRARQHAEAFGDNYNFLAPDLPRDVAQAAIMGVYERVHSSLQPLLAPPAATAAAALALRVPA